MCCNPRVENTLGVTRMTDISSALCTNAIKCMELLHRLVLAWLALAIVTAYLPSAAASAQVKLPFTDVDMPVNSARWACAVVIFFAGVTGCALLQSLRELCRRLAETPHLQVVLTYPSIATLGTARQRVLLGYGLAFVQYSAGHALWSPMPQVFGGAPDIGLAFLFATPMFWFAWELRDWQKGIAAVQSAPPTGSDLPS
jgi:hypothetical protein